MERRTDGRWEGEEESEKSCGILSGAGVWIGTTELLPRFWGACGCWGAGARGGGALGTLIIALRVPAPTGRPPRGGRLGTLVRGDYTDSGSACGLEDLEQFLNSLSTA